MVTVLDAHKWFEKQSGKDTPGKTLQGSRPIFERFSKWSVAQTGWNKNSILGLRLAYGHMQLVIKL